MADATTVSTRTLDTFASDGFYIMENIQDALREAQIFDGARQFSVFNQERAIAGHPREKRLHRMYRIGVVKACNINATVTTDHLCDAGSPAFNIV